MPTLRELLAELPYARLDGDGGTPVSGLAYDSRLLRAGDLFVALPGFHVDGSTFIPAALRRGAVAVVTQSPDAPVPPGVPRVLVPDARRALTDLAATFHGHPARRLRVIGVTGTDGKTTTTHLVSAVLEAAGHRTGFITTADVKVGASIEYNDTQHTTPEPVEVQGLLRRMVDEGVDYAILESSSHALALDRLLHCEFDAAVFTNLSAEHLNFHGSMDAYLEAKARLFRMLDASLPKGIEKTAILNADDPASARIGETTRARIMWYGIEADGETGRRGDGERVREPGSEGARVGPHPDPLPEGEGDRREPLPGGEEGAEAWTPDQVRHDSLPSPTHHSSLITHHSYVRAADVELLPGGARFRLVTPIGSAEVESKLAGRFNVYNWLAAAALGLSQGVTLEQIRLAMAAVDSVPGRMQRIDAGQPFAVVVDFAHTPQALGKALAALRASTAGRLLVLFGLAGERDPGNRPEMGRTAARLADFAVLTTDDPRFEDPMELAEQVAGGAREIGWREGEHYLKIADREEAIREAFRRARAGDTVLLAGKGHERRQVIGDRLVPWNDAEAARRVLRDLGYRRASSGLEKK